MFLICLKYGSLVGRPRMDHATIHMQKIVKARQSIDSQLTYAFIPQM